MQNTSYVALSSQSALMRQMEIVANNIANASTAGYKAEHVLFQQFVAPAAGGTGDSTAFVEDTGSYRDMREGPISRTGNDLDVAIEGSGYLTVSTPQGDRYTRNGHLQLGADGTIVTGAGYPVQGAGGAPLVVPQGSSKITITDDGSVSTSAGQIGKIALVDFPDSAVEPVSGGLYAADAAATPATTATLHQGMVEGSNVQPVVEINRMLDISRSYEAANDMVNGENTRITNAIDKLSKVV